MRIFKSLILCIFLLSSALSFSDDLSEWKTISERKAIEALVQFVGLEPQYKDGRETKIFKMTGESITGNNNVWLRQYCLNEEVCTPNEQDDIQLGSNVKFILENEGSTDTRNIFGHYFLTSNFKDIDSENQNVIPSYYRFTTAMKVRAIHHKKNIKKIIFMNEDNKQLIVTAKRGYILYEYEFAGAEISFSGLKGADNSLGFSIVDSILMFILGIIY